MSDSEAFRLWRVRKTILQMLRDRGYIVQQEDLNMNIETFKERFSAIPSGDTQHNVQYSTISRERMLHLTSSAEDPSDFMFVFFPDAEKIGMDEIKKYYERMKSNNAKRSIIILKLPVANSSVKDLSPQAKKAILSLSTHGYIIETFKESELLVNITEHILVPKHIPLKEDEKMELLKRYKLKETQLPRMKVSDPIARYYGMQRGQVFKIIRPSETAGRYVTYRLVC